METLAARDRPAAPPPLRRGAALLVAGALVLLAPLAVLTKLQQPGGAGGGAKTALLFSPKPEALVPLEVEATWPPGPWPAPSSIRTSASAKLAAVVDPSSLPLNLMDMGEEHEARINEFIDMLSAWSRSSEVIGVAVAAQELRDSANTTLRAEPISNPDIADVFSGNNYQPRRAGEYDDKYTIQASDEYIHNQDDHPRLHILGDSVTSGCCCEGGGGYAAGLGDGLTKKGYHVDIIAGCGKTASAQDGRCNNRQDWGPNFWQKDGWETMCEVTAPDVVLSASHSACFRRLLYLKNTPAHISRATTKGWRLSGCCTAGARRWRTRSWRGRRRR